MNGQLGSWSLIEIIVDRSVFSKAVIASSEFLKALLRDFSWQHLGTESLESFSFSFCSSPSPVIKSSLKDESEGEATEAERVL